MNPETRWIVACLRSLGSEAPVPPAWLDWGRTLAIAETESVAPALGFVFRAGASAVTPAVVREQLSRHLTESTAGQLILTRELSRLLEAFRREGTPVIPLKGPALAEMLYPQPALRPCTDLDLLIQREALITVDGILQRRGYRRRADGHSWSFDVAYDRATVYERPGGVRVDLHWSLLGDPRFVWLEAEGLEIWDRAIKIQVAGETALGLCPEDLVLYLAVHLAVHHGLAGLLWYWDLARLIGHFGERLDWQTVVARASAWRARTALYFALLGCERFFGVSAPPAVMAQLRARGLRAAALRWLVFHREAAALNRLEHVVALLLVDRTRDVVVAATRGLFPSPTWLRARYEGAGSSLAAHYVAHYRRMASIAGATERGLARGGRARGASTSSSTARSRRRRAL
jgi:Uncharacterised nucleotidyltransferase